MSAPARMDRACSPTSAAARMPRSCRDCQAETAAAEGHFGEARQDAQDPQPSWNSSRSSATPATCKRARRGRWAAVRSCCATRSARARWSARQARSPPARSVTAAKESTRIAGPACSVLRGWRATRGICGTRSRDSGAGSTKYLVRCIPEGARESLDILRHMLERSGSESLLSRRSAARLPAPGAGRRELSARAGPQPRLPTDGQAQARGLAPPPHFRIQVAVEVVAERRSAQALDARVRTLARDCAIHRARRRARHAVVRAQLDLPGGAQALRAVLPRQRRALQDAGRDLGHVRVRLPQALHEHDHAGVPRRAGAGRGVGQSHRAHLLALVADGAARSMSIGRRRARSACTRSPTARSRRRGATASTITSSSRTVRGTTCTRAGSTACIPASSPRTRSSSRPRISTGASRERSRTRASRKATLRQKEDLAAVIHLCGAGAGERYARRGLRLVAHQRCGDHDVRAYLNRVQGMKTVFLRLGADS